MAMTTCKECGKQVSTEAKACPHCGAAAPAKKKAKGGVGKWLLIVFAIGLVAMVLPKKDQVAASSAPPKAQAVQSTEKKVKAEAAAAPNTDQCFYRGKALAGVYLANFSKMANADVMASDVMREGCDKVAEEQKTGDACIRSCEIGFKQEARTAFK